MNIFSAIIDSIVSFAKENPLTVIIIVMLLVFAPQLVGGMLIGLIILLGIILLIPALMYFRLRRMSRRMEQEAQQSRQSYHNTSNRRQSGNEGEVKVYATSNRPQKRVNEDVGDYVDFEEVKNDNHKK